MIVYFDTSSLVKAYLEEEYSDEVAALLDKLQTQEAASSTLTYAEMRAALAGAARGQRITQDELRQLKAQFEDSWNAMLHVDANESIVRLAGNLAEEHGLRGSDGIHLASATTLHRDLAEPLAFSAYDDRLRDAAVACGLERI